MNAAAAPLPPLNPNDEERFHVQHEARALAGRVEHPSAGLRLLVVDDEAAVCKALKRNLGRWYEVVALERAREALELITGGQCFDAILCDVVMPEMSGAFTSEGQAFLDSARRRCLDKPLDLQSLRATLEAEAAIRCRVGQP